MQRPFCANRVALRRQRLKFLTLIGSLGQQAQTTQAQLQRAHGQRGHALKAEAAAHAAVELIAAQVALKARDHGRCLAQVLLKVVLSGH